MKQALLVAVADRGPGSRRARVATTTTSADTARPLRPTAATAAATGDAEADARTDGAGRVDRRHGRR